MSSRKRTALSRSLPQLIGVIHLPALAGAPGSRDLHPAEALRRAGARAVEEAKKLARAGFDGIILENFGDVPFYAEQVPPETVASLSVIAAAVRESVNLPIGINILRNDARAAIAVAAVTGCDFVRINVLAGVYAADQGMLQGRAAEWLRERDRLGADVMVLADAQVKHAKSLSASDLAIELEDLALRSGADGVIVTGPTTGRLASDEELVRAAEAARKHGISLFIGSGATPDRLPMLWGLGYGIIVGSALRQAGRAGAPLDAKRTQGFVSAYRKAGTKKKPARSPRGK